MGVGETILKRLDLSNYYKAQRVDKHRGSRRISLWLHVVQHKGQPAWPPVIMNVQIIYAFPMGVP